MINVKKKNFTYSSKGKQYKSFAAIPQDFKKAVIVIHEIWGLNDDIKRITTDFAKEGFLAIAPNLYSHHSPVRVVTDAVFARVFGSPFKEDTIQSLQDLVQYIQKEYNIPAQKIGMTGFCFGGTYAYLYTTRYKDIGGIVPFYGQNPPITDIKNINCPALAFYGKDDKFLMPKVPDLVKEFQKLHKKFDYKAYSGAGHSFMNKKIPGTYKKEVAKDAWGKTVAFFNSNLN